MSTIPAGYAIAAVLVALTVGILLGSWRGRR